MKQLVYTVRVTVPEGENCNYTVQIGKDGMSVGYFTGAFVGVAHDIGQIIMANVEDEA